MTTLSRRSTLRLFGAAGVLAATATPLLAKDAIHQGFTGVAVDGTDVVAYFKENRPVAGVRAHSHDWNGATWRFSSEENRAAFAANPEAYAPQFGGYCAWAVAQGYTASTTPEAWSIHEGKLYLNYSLGVRAQWEEDIPGNVAKGNANWPGVLN